MTSRRPTSPDTPSPLEAEFVAPGSTDEPSPRVQLDHRRVTAIVVTTVIVVALTVTYALRRGDVLLRLDHPSPPPATGQQSVAVFPFTIAPPTQPAANWVATAATEVVTSRVDASNRFRTVSSAVMAEFDLESRQSPTTEATLEARLRRRTGAIVAIHGLCSVRGNQLDVVVTAQSLERHAVLARSFRNGDTSNVAAVAGEAANELLRQLSAANEPLSETPVLPTDAAAARSYAEALRLLRSFHPREARDLLEQVVEDEPSFAPAHSALSDAWNMLGYRDSARSEAERAW
jgi:hypothetical protein